MNLDDCLSFQPLDPQNMIGEIDGLPDQLQAAWELGFEKLFDSRPLQDGGGLKQVVIAGMGGSAIGADLVAVYLAPTCKIPVIVHRDYGLPAWASGARTLVIASSHSGNTEETLDSFEMALKAGCQVMAICTGGDLEQRARAAGVPVLKFAHKGQPRAAVGFSFGLLLAALARVGLVEPAASSTTEVVTTIREMKKQQENLRAGIFVARNPAKRLAGQLVGRWVNVFGSGMLVPVARRWKTQINEIAKAGAGFEVLPEADHNTLAGLVNPEDVLSRTFSIFLRAPSDHPRNRLRTDQTRQDFMLQGLNADFYDTPGSSTLSQMWTALHFGDYLAYYLAMAYGVDPTPVEALERFKASMKAAG